MSDTVFLSAGGTLPSEMKSGTFFKNLAYAIEDTEAHALVDATVLGELNEAGIKVEGLESLRGHYEVPTKYVGSLAMWGFRRAWRYYIASGPGVPPDLAEEFHGKYGKQVRVQGHCGCPSPLEYNHGFAVGMYHIDSQNGLNAFAELLRKIYR